MTDTPRRALLTAIAAAPVLAVAGGARALSLPDLAALDEVGLLEEGTRTSDAEFARLCSDALLEHARGLAAERTHSAAAQAAPAATPAFPLALTMSCVQYDCWPSPEPKREWTAQWHPEHRGGGYPSLEVYARRYAKAQGVQYSRAVENDLRAQYGAWEAACNEARARFRTEELAQACDAAWDVAGAARQAVLRHPARSPDVLLVKVNMWLREALDSSDDDEARRLAVIVADVSRVLAV